MALNFVGINDDNAISAFTGETGGDWTLAVAPYADSGGTDGAIGLQVAFSNGLYQTQSTGALNVGSVAGGNLIQAQSFLAPGNCTQTRLLCARNGSPADNLVVEIQTDSSDAPSGTVVASGSVLGSSLTAAPTYTWTDIDVSATLTATTKYWLVVTRSGAFSDAAYYNIQYSSTDVWAGGVHKPNAFGTWGAAAGDLAFGVLNRGGDTGTIDGGAFTQADGTDGWGCIGFALIGTTVVLDQQHYRFRNDDGNETTATWLADLDTDVN